MVFRQEKTWIKLAAAVTGSEGGRPHCFIITGWWSDRPGVSNGNVNSGRIGHITHSWHVVVTCSSWTITTCPCHKEDYEDNDNNKHCPESLVITNTGLRKIFKSGAIHGCEESVRSGVIILMNMEIEIILIKLMMGEPECAGHSYGCCDAYLSAVTPSDSDQGSDQGRDSVDSYMVTHTGSFSGSRQVDISGMGREYNREIRGSLQLEPAGVGSDSQSFYLNIHNDNLCKMKQHCNS